MQRTLEVINDMEAEGIISRYAIAGAVAAYYYIEPIVTEDLGIRLESLKLDDLGQFMFQPQRPGCSRRTEEGLSCWSEPDERHLGGRPRSHATRWLTRCTRQ